MNKFNEDSRVKIPTILHLIKLGYSYLSLKTSVWDKETNIFTDIFKKAFLRINEGSDESDFKKVYDDLSLSLDNEDLGRAFYNKLTDRSGARLIDFENFENNSFHVATELPCENGDDSFRPDITILINGLPLVFIEVKKPNNLDGVLAERKRMDRRFQNKKFKKFWNITQFMIFSNNMEYDEFATDPIQGAFYASTSNNKAIFNYFREEETLDLKEILSPISAEQEDAILKDTNLISIKGSPEFKTNNQPTSATNKICTSLLSKDRLKFILQYALAYVEESTGLQKHIMRYPQMFATKAIERKLNEGIKKGIIWHTQGSGKTALTYYNTKFLTDYYQQKGIIPKFYFIVDRIDLAIQASKEFKSRGLTVHKIESRDAFAKDIKSTSAVHNDSGKAEITVVNIQKFKDDPTVVQNADYNVNIQRVYFLDEVHRSYNPKGSFLANLRESDPNSIKIGLTGTPLLGDEYNSRLLFGDYIHKYYYNSSIADGYTLRLIREEIATSYKLEFIKRLEDSKVLEGEGDKRIVFAHQHFVEPMLDYIVEDLELFRAAYQDNSVGGMVVCDSSQQAKKMAQIFNDKYAIQDHLEEAQPLMAAEPRITYGKRKENDRKVKTCALILHDIGNKDDRKDVVQEYKDGKIDILFVYNMLLTGFDAKRLKKLYIGRVIKSHNLLQTLTRVNRTYKDFKYGYVVDFADIESEFEKTNEAYFNELQSELGDEMEHYSNLFKTAAEIKEDIQNIENTLLHFDTKNREAFSNQMIAIKDKKEVQEIVSALNEAKGLYNLIRLSGNYELLDKLDFKLLNTLATIAQDRLAMLNQKERLEKGDETLNLLNVALENVLFDFTKVKQEEMKLADELKSMLERTRLKLGGSFDPKDPNFISLKEELERLFKKKNLSEVSKDAMLENTEALNRIYDLATEIERKNNLVSAKYANDNKYMRIHKRLLEKDPLTENEKLLFEVLNKLKLETDAQILQNSEQLNNEAYVDKMIGKIIFDEFKTNPTVENNLENVTRLKALVTKEYLDEYNGRIA